MPNNLLDADEDAAHSGLLIKSATRRRSAKARHHRRPTARRRSCWRLTRDTVSAESPATRLKRLGRQHSSRTRRQHRHSSSNPSSDDNVKQQAIRYIVLCLRRALNAFSPRGRSRRDGSRGLEDLGATRKRRGPAMMTARERQ